MKFNTTTVITLGIICCMLILPSLLHAQGPGFGDDTDDVPIDGGLSLLAAAGIGYGVKKYRQRNKQQDQQAL